MVQGLPGAARGPARKGGGRSRETGGLTQGAKTRQDAVNQRVRQKNSPESGLKQIGA
jgi:hypothetical protein